MAQDTQDDFQRDIPDWPSDNQADEERTILCCLLGSKADEELTITQPFKGDFGYATALYETLRHDTNLAWNLAARAKPPDSDDWKTDISYAEALPVPIGFVAGPLDFQAFLSRFSGKRPGFVD